MLFLLLFSCTHRETKPAAQQERSRLPLTSSTASSAPVPFDPPIKETDVRIEELRDPVRVQSGETIYRLQCRACHRLDGEKLVGPGWKNITRKRTPAWLLNMMVYTPLMLANDPEAKYQLQVYQITMPDQKLTMEKARDVLAFMLKNDEQK